MGNRHITYKLVPPSTRELCHVQRNQIFLCSMESFIGGIRLYQMNKAFTDARFKDTRTTAYAAVERYIQNLIRLTTSLTRSGSFFVRVKLEIVESEKGRDG